MVLGHAKPAIESRSLAVFPFEVVAYVGQRGSASTPLASASDKPRGFGTEVLPATCRGLGLPAHALDRFPEVSCIDWTKLKVLPDKNQQTERTVPTQNVSFVDNLALAREVIKETWLNNFQTETEPCKLPTNCTKKKTSVMGFNARPYLLLC